MTLRIKFRIVQERLYELIPDSYLKERFFYCLVSHSQLFCNPMDCSLLDSSVCGMFQARLPECVAIFSSRVSSWPRDQAHILESPALQGDSLPLSHPPGKPNKRLILYIYKYIYIFFIYIYIYIHTHTHTHTYLWDAGLESIFIEIKGKNRMRNGTFIEKQILEIIKPDYGNGEYICILCCCKLKGMKNTMSQHFYHI